MCIKLSTTTRAIHGTELGKWENANQSHVGRVRQVVVLVGRVLARLDGRKWIRYLDRNRRLPCSDSLVS
jgi:hypothetical protein